MSESSELKNVHRAYLDYLPREQSQKSKRVTLTHALLVLLISSQVTLTLTFLSIKQPIETTASIDTKQSIENISKVLRYLVDKSKDAQTISSAEEKQLLATVKPARLNLRQGPGKDYKPLMTVAAGTTLLIESQSNGEWVSVIAPSGEKAFALKDELSFEATTL